jgi:hypothetical protein
VPCRLPERIIQVYRGAERNNGDAVGIEGRVIEVAHAAGAAHVVGAAGGGREVGEALGAALAARYPAADEYFAVPSQGGQ